MTSRRPLKTTFIYFPLLFIFHFNVKLDLLQIGVAYLSGCSGGLSNIWKKQIKSQCYNWLLWLNDYYFYSGAQSHLYVGVTLVDLTLVYLVRWHWIHHPPLGSVQREINTTLQWGKWQDQIRISWNEPICPLWNSDSLTWDCLTNIPWFSSQVK